MPAVYLPPNFNVTCNVWQPPHTPAANLPDTAGLFQIYLYSRTPQMLLHPGSGRWLPLIIIREAFAAAQHLGINHIVGHTGPPLAPNAYYKVQYALRMHVGFPNQYFAYPSLQCNSNGTIPLTPLPT
jgi:hypothetical protein